MKKGRFCQTRSRGRLHVLTAPEFVIAPDSIWTRIPEPPPGYHFRTMIEVGDEEPVEALLDGGSVYSLIAEEFLVELINAATSAGLTPDHEPCV